MERKIRLNRAIQQNRSRTEVKSPKNLLKRTKSLLREPASSKLILCVSLREVKCY